MTCGSELLRWKNLRERVLSEVSPVLEDQEIESEVSNMQMSNNGSTTGSVSMLL